MRSIAAIATLFSVLQMFFIHLYCFTAEDHIKGSLLGATPATTTTTTLSLRQRQPPQTKGTLQQSGHTPDAYLNIVPLYRQNAANHIHSSIHCVGETPFEETSWIYRSCQYTYLCFHPQTYDFFVVDSPQHQALQQHLQQRPASKNAHWHVSTDLYHSSNNNNNNITTPPLALGGINSRWNGTAFNEGLDKVKWAPNVVESMPSSYYLMDDNIVLVPFHSFAGHNVGHLLWDDFLPIYTLLQMFGYVDTEGDDNHQPLLLRVNTLPILYASCDMRRNKKMGCKDNFNKFLPLMGVDPSTFTTLTEVHVTSSMDSDSKAPAPESLPICAKHAVAGLGMLTDHGLKDHGWEPLPTDGVFNVGRASQLYQFRNFMLRNMGLPVKTAPPLGQQLQQFHILLNAHSSRDPDRDMSLEVQHKAITRAFPKAKVSLVQLKEYSLKEQLELVSQKTNIFVSTCGGGSMTAFFLPRGSSLILYYADNAGFNYASYKLTGGPAILDWDLLNNVGYLKVHWLPIIGMHSSEGLSTLVSLIQHEMDAVLNL
jgi:hypothetical protein